MIIKIFRKREISIIAILILTAIAINYKMIRDGIIFNAHDILFHVQWLQHFSKQLSEGIIYPRWLAGMNYGYGSPTFVFYPPLFFYLGSFLKISGLDTQKAIIALCTLIFFGAGLSFYLYSRNRWGKAVSCLAAIVYITSPYLFLNIYVRGALPETLALVWLPVGLLLTDKAIWQPKWSLLLAILFAILSLTHVPSLLVYTIFWVFYVLSFLLQGHSWKAIARTIGSALLGFGISSFYLLPTVLEKSLVNLDSQRIVSGGFKANLIGTTVSWASKTMRSEIQPIFIQQSLLIITLAAMIFICYRQDSGKIRQTVYWLIFLLILAFLMTYPSERIWQYSRILQMVQFPWRLMGLFSFGFASIFAIAISGLVSQKLSLKVIVVLTILVTMFGNVSYDYQIAHRSRSFNNPGDLAPNAKVKPQYDPYYRFQEIKLALKDPYTDRLRDVPEYLPLLPTGNPAPQPLLGQAHVTRVSGQATLEVEQWDSYRRIFKASASQRSVIKIRTYYYPAWHLYVNQKPHPSTVAPDGTIQIELEPGSHIVELRYLWTGAFKLGVAISICSLSLLILLWFKFPRFLL